MNEKQLVVGIADMKICRLSGVLITYALGSCVGVCLYDPVIRLAGMVHIMLPNNMDSKSTNLFKYADTGIAETVRKMEVFGAVRSRMIAKIAGGARMFDIQGGGSIGNIGQRNIESVRKVLAQERIRLLAEDTGQNYARTLLFDASNGEGRIRSFGKKEIIF
jgi:chemotaxis protein CheD